MVGLICTRRQQTEGFWYMRMAYWLNLEIRAVLQDTYF